MKKGLIVILMALIPFWAGATEFSFKGEMRTRMSAFTDTEEAGLEEAAEISKIDSRIRFYTKALYSDAAAFTLGIEIGDFDWGREGHNKDEKIVEVKHAYMDLTPDFSASMKFRLGLQGYKDLFGQAVFDEDAAGLLFMPEMENVDLRTGFFILSDDEAKGNADNSRTLALMDAALKSGSSTWKGALYYDYYRHEAATLYLAGGGDFQLDSLGFGAQAVYMTRSFHEEGLDNISGLFAHLYTRFKKDKFTVQAQLGYSPAGENGYFEGIEEYADLYGLEYAYKGSVYDGQNLLSGYGGEMGQMVFALNLTYDFLFANAGIIRATHEDLEEKALGTEFDLGFKTSLTKKVDFTGVYALFMPGKAFGENDKTAHELATQLKFKF
ncbi:MAG TPA: hypothetical protein PLV02_05355 [Candidatus Mcinerneyibacteriales bacterium]|nr:hypothetical protein [Candidatus Mcinerneyibacteriales bacterium]